jgi:Zinc finger, C3HC4 type (RING finger)
MPRHRSVTLTRSLALCVRRWARCVLCLDDEVKIEDMVTLSCDHRHCRDCFANYLKSKISEKQVSK